MPKGRKRAIKAATADEVEVSSPPLVVAFNLDREGKMKPSLRPIVSTKQVSPVLSKQVSPVLSVLRAACKSYEAQSLVAAAAATTDGL